MPKHKQTPNLLQRIARNLCVSVIIISPWLIGSSEGWAYLLMSIITAFATIMWLFSLLSEKTINIKGPVVLLAMLMFIAFTAFQALHIPQRIVRTLNPSSAAITAQGSAVIKSAKTTIDSASPPSAPSRGTAKPLAKTAASLRAISPILGDSMPSLSVSSHGTTRALMLMAAFVAVFAILSNTITSWHELRKASAAIVTFGAFMAFIAIVHEFSGEDKILWIHNPRYGGGVFGPFTNNNHAALHINMLFGLALGLFLSLRRSSCDSSQKSSDARFGHLILLIFAMIILGGATCFSLSRGGIVSLMLALGIIFMFAGNKSFQTARPRLIASGLMIMAGLLWLGWEPVITELGTILENREDLSDDQRMIVYHDTLKMFLDYPVFGCGYGTFQYLFPSYQSLTGYFRWSHAHNDWAQLLAEGGIIGTGLFLTAAFLFGRYLQTCHRKAGYRAGVFALGTLAGILATAIYSFWEYGIHKPANGFLLMGLAGLSVAALTISNPSAEYYNNHKPNGPSKCMNSGLAIRLVIAGLIIATAWQTGLLIQQFKGEIAYSRFTYYQNLARAESIPEKYNSAVLAACREAEIMCSMPIENPSALREISTIMMLWSSNEQLSEDVRQQSIKTGLDSAEKATQASPSDYLAWVALARMHAVLNSWETAEIYLKHARKLAAPGMPVRMFIPASQE